MNVALVQGKILAFLLIPIHQVNLNEERGQNHLASLLVSKPLKIVEELLEILAEKLIFINTTKQETVQHCQKQFRSIAIDQSGVLHKNQETNL